MNKGEKNQQQLPGIHIPRAPAQACLADCKKAQAAPGGSEKYYLCLYRLGKDDLRKLKVRDGYSIHRIVYDLFPLSEKGEDSRILYADKGPGRRWREILILANRKPNQPEYGELWTKALPASYLASPTYRFDVTVNPVIRNPETKKIEPVRNPGEIARWFLKKAPAFGFAIEPQSLEVQNIHVDKFEKSISGKSGEKKFVTLEKARLTGILSVTDKECFIKSVYGGIGRGKAFGCGLLQIAPF